MLVASASANTSTRVSQAPAPSLLRSSADTGHGHTGRCCVLVLAFQHVVITAAPGGGGGGVPAPAPAGARAGCKCQQGEGRVDVDTRGGGVERGGECWHCALPALLRTGGGRGLKRVGRAEQRTARRTKRVWAVGCVGRVETGGSVCQPRDVPCVGVDMMWMIENGRKGKAQAASCSNANARVQVQVQENCNFKICECKRTVLCAVLWGCEGWGGSSARSPARCAAAGPT